MGRLINKFSLGMVQTPLVLVLLFLALIIPISARFVQNSSLDTRSKADYGCQSNGTPCGGSIYPACNCCDGVTHPGSNLPPGAVLCGAAPTAGGSCLAGDMQCVGGQYRVCSGGQWTSYSQCPSGSCTSSYACSTVTCSGTCLGGGAGMSCSTYGKESGTGTCGVDSFGTNKLCCAGSIPVATVTPPSGTCTGLNQCYGATCNQLGKVSGTGTCAVGQFCCRVSAVATPTQIPACILDGRMCGGVNGSCETECCSKLKNYSGGQYYCGATRLPTAAPRKWSFSDAGIYIKKVLDIFKPKTAYAAIQIEQNDAGTCNYFFGGTWSWDCGPLSFVDVAYETCINTLHCSSMPPPSDEMCYRGCGKQTGACPGYCVNDGGSCLSWGHGSNDVLFESGNSFCRNETGSSSSSICCVPSTIVDGRPTSYDDCATKSNCNAISNETIKQTCLNRCRVLFPLATPTPGCTPDGEGCGQYNNLCSTCCHSWHGTYGSQVCGPIPTNGPDGCDTGSFMCYQNNSYRCTSYNANPKGTWPTTPYEVCTSGVCSGGHCVQGCMPNGSACGQLNDPCNTCCNSYHGVTGSQVCGPPPSGSQTCTANIEYMCFDFNSYKCNSDGYWPTTPDRICNNGCSSGKCVIPGVPTKIPVGNLPTVGAQPTSVPAPTGAPAPGPGPGPGTGSCQYHSLQARVQDLPTNPLSSNITIQSGATAGITCTHDATGVLAGNVKITALHNTDSTKNKTWTQNNVSGWVPPVGIYTVYCESTDSKCSTLKSDSAQIKVNGSAVGGNCLECPNSFHCYGHKDFGYKWFVAGYEMDGFGLAVDQYCVDAGIVKPTWKGKSKGDANCDGVINGADLSLWRREYIDVSLGQAVSRNNWEADFTGPQGVCDGIVNGADYSLWRRSYSDLGGGR